MEKTTLTITHIQRPFHRLSDDFRGNQSLPQHFYHAVPFYTPEGDDYLFHVKGKTQYFSAQEMKEKVESGLVIHLPYSVDILSTQALYFGLTSTIYAADKIAPKWEDKTYFCALTSLRDYQVKAYLQGDSISFYDVLIITHLLKPYEGYPTEECVLRAMTTVTETLTEQKEKHRAFGPRRITIRNQEEKFKQWEEEGRLIKLSKPLLFNSGPYDVKERDLGESFWTDHTRKHYYGKLPNGSRCYFYTHVCVYKTKPLDGEIVRRQGYYAVYYLLDVGGCAFSGYPPTEDHFKENEESMQEKVDNNQVVKLPVPYRYHNASGQLWIGAQGNVYGGHGIKPHDYPYVLLMNSQVIANLPQTTDTYIQFEDFAVTA